MPKLDAQTAAKVNEAEFTGGLMEEGTYRMVLTAVDAVNKKTGEPLVGAKGPYWSWEFTVPKEAERYAGRKLWSITSLSEESAGNMKMHFDAFGVASDTDTDDLVARGAEVDVVVGKRKINQGVRAGEDQNIVRMLLPVDGVKAASNGGKSNGATSKKDLF